MEELGKELGSLFDSCDVTSMGKVTVSKLLLAFTNEAVINLNNNDDNQLENAEELLNSVRFLLDPSNQDVQVDKDTWLAAWRKQAETPSPKKSQQHNILDLAGGDFGVVDITGDCQGPLDVSKNSYCFSPGSRSSSLEEEDLVLLKEELRQSTCDNKTLKQQLQKQEDALLQEQAEKQDLENLRISEVNKNYRLTKQIKSLLDMNAELKCSLDVSEREKLDLCTFVESLSMAEKQLKLELNEQKRVVAALSSEIEDVNEEKENLKLSVLDLQAKMEHQRKVHQEQTVEYQKTIQDCLREKDELASSMLVGSKASIMNEWNALDCSGSNLKAELSSVNFQPDFSFGFDSSPSAQKSLLVEMEAVTCDAETQTVEDIIVIEPLQGVDQCNQAEPETCHAATQTIEDIILIETLKGVDRCNQAEPETCDAETQTVEDIILIETLKGVDRCNQAEPETYDAETQTVEDITVIEPLKRFDKCNQAEPETCDAEIQTVEDITVIEPLKGFHKCNQAEPEMFAAETQISPLAIRKNHKFSLSRYFTKHFSQPDPGTGETDISEISPGVTLRISEEQSNVNTSLAPVLQKKSRLSCLWATLTCAAFLILLVISTIFCTGAVLQIASESGVLSFPLISRSPEFVKSILRPFVKVTVHRPPVYNVPV